MNQTTRQLIDTHTQLAAARNILAATGKSPRQLGDESRRKVIEWIYRWGYTSPTLIQTLLKRTAGGYGQKLVRQGWLKSTKTESGVPVAYLTLTEQGLQEAERHARKLHRYSELDPYKVNQQQIRHYLMAQRATLDGINQRVIAQFATERMFAQAGDKSGQKRPDVIWLTKTDLRIGIEIELSSKWGRDLDEFIMGIVRALESAGNKPVKYSRFAVISDSKAILENYRIAVQPGAALPIWKKNQRQHWVIEKTVSVPDWLIKKIDFQLIGE